MKIAFYLSAFPVLSETFIHRQIAEMKRRGHDVTIIAARRAAEGPAHDTVLKNDLMENAIFLDGTSRRGLWKALRAAVLWPLASPFEFVGSAVSRLRSGSIKAFAKELRTWDSLRNIRFDAVIAHFGPAALEAQSLVDRGFFSGPVFPVFHGYDVTRYVRQNGKDVYKALFDRVPACLAISDRWAGRLQELGCPPNKIAVHRVGLDVESIQFTPKECFSSPLQVLSVCRLVEKKGIEYGIRAVAAAKALISMKYVIAGDGPLLPPLKKLVESLGVDDVVSFVGPLPEQDIKSLMVSSDILLVPSVVASDGDEEGIPVVIMEAMAAGLPVIASSHSGIPELVLDGQTGTLVSEGDVKGLADGLVAVVRRGPQRDILYEARNRVASMHSITLLSAHLEFVIGNWQAERQ